MIEAQKSLQVKHEQFPFPWLSTGVISRLSRLPLLPPIYRISQALDPVEYHYGRPHQTTWLIENTLHRNKADMKPSDTQST